MLSESLATHLGAGLYGEFGFVPSLANVADDPTRGKGPPPTWLQEALHGDYKAMDEWLGSLGYDPIEVARLPFSPSVSREVPAVESHLEHLRSVQKPERLRRFDEERNADSRVVELISVSPAVAEDSKNSQESIIKSLGANKKVKKQGATKRRLKGPPKLFVSTLKDG